MLPNKNNSLLFISGIIVLEILIYLWSLWTSTYDRANFFAIEPDFIFDKCARNSGRVSSLINLAILVMVGSFGLKQIFVDENKLNQLRVLLTIFAINHLIHFFFVLQNFHHHAMELSISGNRHGFISFLGILLFTVIVWKVKRLNRALNISLVLHLLNVSYFIMETFYNKIKPDHPAYHNQIGIAITAAGCIFVLSKVVQDFKVFYKE